MLPIGLCQTLSSSIKNETGRASEPLVWLNRNGISNEVSIEKRFYIASISNDENS